MKNKRLVISILLFTGLVLVASCVDDDEPQIIAQYRKINAEEALRMMHDSKDYILLDVRTIEEFTEKHIEGAILIPDYELAERAAIELPDKAMLILVYCRSGRRSESAAHELVEMGYINVYDIGGIVDWPF